MNDDASSTVQELALAKELLAQWVDIMGSKCRYDHDGNCQEHFIQSKDECIVFLTKNFLQNK